MKTLIFVLFGAAFLVAVVKTQNNQITDTKRQPCPVNEILILCQPCESFCNEEPKTCLAVCLRGNFCTCANGYTRISKDIRICVPNKWCSLFAKPNCKTTTTTTDTTTIAIPKIEPPKNSYDYSNFP